MLMVVNILILFFIILIGYQLILAIHVKEGLENNSSDDSYQAYDPENTLILAQQNAGNIEYLKQRMDSVQGMFQQVQDLSGNVSALQDQVNGLVSAQQEYATQMTGGVAPDITGTTEEGEPEEPEEPE